MFIITLFYPPPSLSANIFSSPKGGELSLSLSLSLSIDILDQTFGFVFPPIPFCGDTVFFLSVAFFASSESESL